jgi:hypothetical protein
VLMSMGSDEVHVSPSKTRAHDTDDYIPDLGGQTKYPFHYLVQYQLLF